MMALIMAGGKGTRLQPYSFSIPKPLMPIGERPILEIVIRQLREAGISRIVVALGHMSYFFEAFVEEWKRRGLEIGCVYEDEPLGTAGAIRLVPALEDPVLVMNGDLLTTLDYRALVGAHTAWGAWGTIAMSHREMRVDYGVVRMTDEGLLDRYDEKPVIQYDVSMGINVLTSRCVEFIPEGRGFDIPDLMLAMKAAGKPVYCYQTDCYWQDIGRVEDLQRASADFADDPGRFLSRSDQG